MDAGGRIDTDAALSLLGWWDEAGVGAPVSEVPRDWLARKAPPSAPAATAAPAASLAGLPDTLQDFVEWRLRGDDLPDAGWGSPRIRGGSEPAALMVLVDMPEPDDGEQLMAGDVGRLFDRMLAAIGHSRETICLAAIAWARPPGGAIPPAAAERLAALARHHVALVAPKRLLLMGQATSRALLTTELSQARGSEVPVNVGSGQCEAIVTYHPRMLMKTPAAKPGAWRDLLALKRGLEA
ncbi:DNA polymerase [Sphingomonas jejuensis]|uniref:DNA polymerase n=1 Tax=Sphingomonas jejuensis TaxID=904715 RepID=A0ABX0XLK3_9SPHN|nr:uracil-DNA glycosylase family protein [Sphingomonas jejuensis]NJC33646.1 DNA polymerase [Sphingomonas jejuensis]